jgi:hypothetical protein
MIHVKSTVTAYEVNDAEDKTPLNKPRPGIIVESHWNRSEMVVIEWNGQRMTFVARDLEAAIANARNSAR